MSTVNTERPVAEIMAEDAAEARTYRNNCLAVGAGAFALMTEATTIPGNIGNTVLTGLGALTVAGVVFAGGFELRRRVSDAYSRVVRG